MTKPILSDPRHGWATLTLPTENDEQPFITNISYVTDVMFNALSACINYLDDGIAAVKFNAEENGDIIILIDTCDCKVIYENNKILNINLSGDNFCKNILDCYTSDRNTWMQFGTMDDNPEVADMQRQTFQKLETILRTSMAIRTEVYTCMKGDNHED